MNKKTKPTNFKQASDDQDTTITSKGTDHKKAPNNFYRLRQDASQNPLSMTNLVRMVKKCQQKCNKIQNKPINLNIQKPKLIPKQRSQLQHKRYEQILDVINNKDSCRVIIKRPLFKRCVQCFQQAQTKNEKINLNDIKQFHQFIQKHLNIKNKIVVINPQQIHKKQDVQFITTLDQQDYQTRIEQLSDFMGFLLGDSSIYQEDQAQILKRQREQFLLSRRNNRIFANDLFRAQEPKRNNDASNSINLTSQHFIDTAAQEYKKLLQKNLKQSNSYFMKYKDNKYLQHIPQYQSKRMHIQTQPLRGRQGAQSVEKIFEVSQKQIKNSLTPARLGSIYAIAIFLDAMQTQQIYNMKDILHTLARDKSLFYFKKIIYGKQYQFTVNCNCKIVTFLNNFQRQLQATSIAEEVLSQSAKNKKFPYCNLIVHDWYKLMGFVALHQLFLGFKTIYKDKLIKFNTSYDPLKRKFIEFISLTAGHQQFLTNANKKELRSMNSHLFQQQHAQFNLTDDLTDLRKNLNNQDQLQWFITNLNDQFELNNVQSQFFKSQVWIDRSQQQKAQKSKIQPLNSNKMQIQLQKSTKFNQPKSMFQDQVINFSQYSQQMIKKSNQDQLNRLLQEQRQKKIDQSKRKLQHSVQQKEDQLQQIKMEMQFLKQQLKQERQKNPSQEHNIQLLQKYKQIKTLRQSKTVQQEELERLSHQSIL